MWPQSAQVRETQINLRGESLEVNYTQLDRIRTDTYKAAIMRHQNLIAGEVVMDVGCGTGIVSIFCAHAGANRSISGGKSFAEILLNNSRGDFNPSDNSFRATSLLKMAHGGTNFGFLSGANTDSNDESAYNPDLTSYDYIHDRAQVCLYLVQKVREHCRWIIDFCFYIIC